MPVAGHVALNALFLDPGVSGGPETYLRGLVPELAAQRPGLRIDVLTTRRGAARLRADGWTDFATLVALRCDEGQRGRRLLAEQVSAGVNARRRGAQLLHSTASVGPIRAGLPHVVSLHDVTFFHIRTFGLATTLVMRWVIGGAARNADALIAVSATARDDAAETLQIPRERFVVAPNGAGLPPRAAPATDVRERLDLGDLRVVLCVGAIRPHKNQALLVRALDHLPDDIVLVLAGAQEAYAGTLGHHARMRTPGYVDEPTLEGLWREAACAAFPTRAEGFGLPVLEAFQRGVAVACSDIAVLHEVGGDVPHYFDPDDPAGAARAIEAAMAAGPDPRAAAQAAAFTWEESAARTLEAYDRALSCTSG